MSVLTGVNRSGVRKSMSSSRTCPSLWLLTRAAHIPNDVALDLPDDVHS